MKVLVLGATGLLGHTVFRVLGADRRFRVTGTTRDESIRERFAPALRGLLMPCGDLRVPTELTGMLKRAVPEVVVNCLSASRAELRDADAMGVISILSVLPRRLARLCAVAGARLIHISSDGVFSGATGRYTEADLPDAEDLYGTAKLLGEADGSHAVSIRTSMIGPELRSANGLLEWFLAQQAECRAFPRAVFSGLPTIELARVIGDFIIPNMALAGVYHVAAAPISKLDLLRLVADVYRKTITLVPDDTVVIDRSLDASKFQAATGYVAPDWPTLVRAMQADHRGSGADSGHPPSPATPQ